MSFYFILLKIIALLLIAHTCFKLFMRLTSGWCLSQTCLVGKTIVITGADKGIGYETALDLAKRGGRVILACRNKDNAEKARNKIIEETKNNNIIVKLVDFTSFKSVRAFAKDINESEERLDVLINNAGAFKLPNELTEDGNSLIIQVNHLGPFLLTNLLGNLLKKTENSRIVNVSSYVAKQAKPEIDNLNAIDSNPINIYARTKLYNIYFTKELANRLRGSSTTTYSLHPGLIQTDLYRNFNPIIRIALNYFINSVSKTRTEGAQTTIYTAVARDIEKYNGEHFQDCQKVDCYKSAKDESIGKKLWEKSEELVKLTTEERQF